MTLIIVLAVILFSVILHENAHGWAAERYGDSTARLSGRLTFNPLAHIDPVGTIIFPFLLYITQKRMGVETPLIFGWAKPVPVNFRNLRNPKQDMMKVGAAGPLSNILLALLCALILKTVKPLPHSLLAQTAGFGIFINLALAVFNLVPIPPLDGSRILTGLLSPRLAYNYSRLEPFSFIILIFAIFYLGLLRFIWFIVMLLARFLLGPQLFMELLEKVFR